MVAEKFIDLTTTECVTPFLFASKKYGPRRLCIDYLRQSSISTRHSYHLPCRIECMDRSGDVTVSSTPNTNCWYWQIEVAERDRGKTSLTPHHDIYRLTGMPLGPKNALVPFQTAIGVMIVSVR